MTFADTLDILYEDNHCIAVNKPCGWPSAHFDGRNETVDRLVKSYLRERYNKPGNVFLGVVHRLDKPVSGVLLFARTSKAASRLSEQFRENSIDKVYWAMVEAGKPIPEASTLEDWLLRQEGEMEKVIVVDPSTADARQALLHLEKKAENRGLAWLELRPQTGRTHQLRVQLSSRGWPIYADGRYGSLARFGVGIGLHARSLTFLHPIRNEPITLTADVPRVWKGRFARLLQGKLT